MASPTVDNLPPPVDAAVRAAVFRDLPGRDISHIRIADSAPSAFVVRVFLPVPHLKPSPYRIYRIDLTSLAVRQLSGDDAKPYRIAHYK
jgi:hypothetical protein